MPFPLSLATFLTNGTCSKNVTLLKSFLSYPTSIWFSASSLSSSLPEEEEDVLVLCPLLSFGEMMEEYHFLQLQTQTQKYLNLVSQEVSESDIFMGMKLKQKCL